MIAGESPWVPGHPANGAGKRMAPLIDGHHVANLWRANRAVGAESDTGATAMCVLGLHTHIR